jgi:hypothetical protein
MDSFDLGLPETFVRLKLGGRQFTHYFASPSPEASKAYLGALKLTRTTKDFKTYNPESDATEADLALWQTCIVRVEGYKSKTLGDLSLLPDWKQHIPTAHKQAFASYLFVIGVAPVETASEYFDDDLEVSLNALQNQKMIRNLIHRFRFPSTSELKEWNRSQSTQKVEVTRKGTIIHRVNRIDTEVKLYDAMITGVKNYTFNGTALITANDAAAMMNPVHKSNAIQAAFLQVKGDGETPIDEVEQSPFGETSSERESGSS